MAKHIRTLRTRSIGPDSLRIVTGRDAQTAAVELKRIDAAFIAALDADIAVIRADALGVRRGVLASLECAVRERLQRPEVSDDEASALRTIDGHARRVAVALSSLPAHGLRSLQSERELSTLRFLFDKRDREVEHYVDTLDAHIRSIRTAGRSIVSIATPRALAALEAASTATRALPPPSRFRIVGGVRRPTMWPEIDPGVRGAAGNWSTIRAAAVDLSRL